LKDIPGAANQRLKALKALFAWACEDEPELAPQKHLTFLVTEYGKPRGVDHAAGRSIATTHRGSFAITSMNFHRDSLRRKITLPSRAAACSWNACFARSTPTMLTSVMDASSSAG
jgi:hypothetical protein